MGIFWGNPWKFFHGFFFFYFPKQTEEILNWSGYNPAGVINWGPRSSQLKSVIFSEMRGS